MAWAGLGWVLNHWNLPLQNPLEGTEPYPVQNTGLCSPKVSYLGVMHNNCMQSVGPFPASSLPQHLPQQLNLICFPHLSIFCEASRT